MATNDVTAAGTIAPPVDENESRAALEALKDRPLAQVAADALEQCEEYLHQHGQTIRQRDPFKWFDVQHRLGMLAATLALQQAVEASNLVPMMLAPEPGEPGAEGAAADPTKPVFVPPTSGRHRGSRGQ